MSLLSDLQRICGAAQAELVATLIERLPEEQRRQLLADLAGGMTPEEFGQALAKTLEQQPQDQQVDALLHLIRLLPEAVQVRLKAELASDPRSLGKLLAACLKWFLVVSVTVVAEEPTHRFLDLLRTWGSVIADPPPTTAPPPRATPGPHPTPRSRPAPSRTPNRAVFEPETVPSRRASSGGAPVTTISTGWWPTPIGPGSGERRVGLPASSRGAALT